MKNGFHPFLIRDGWQLAQLNYTNEQHIGQLDKLDVHSNTDEVFVLLKGNAALIGASIGNGSPSFEIELMRPNVIYNIPQNVWHNIALEEGCGVLIAEKSNTHIADVEHFPLKQKMQEELKALVKALFDSVK